MNIQLDDNIAALATPAGVGAISIIRISGKTTIHEVDKIFSGSIKLVEAKTHTIHYGKIINSTGETIDDVLVSVFKNPNSFTGEDSVEISTHGSPLITQKIIALLLEKDIRLAEPGEFTKRAFVNGKIDLSQAEAVADIINARTETSLRGARNQLDGILSKKVDELRKRLIDTSSMVELELDFAEEDIEFLAINEVKARVNKIILEIENLLSTYSYGRVIRDGVNVALVGKPNVGKSSLLNHILKESRAIVSEIPGTTRDVIREEVSIKGVLFKFYDTAGIRFTEDMVEKEGVFRSREAVKNSDIVLFINDVESGIDNFLGEEILNLSSPERIISVVNKIDLNANFSSEDSEIKISALTGEGIQELFDILFEKVFHGKTYTESSAIVTNARHFNSLRKAKTNLEDVLNSIDASMSGEFLSVDIRNAASSLGEIIGEITSDDILNNIFENFCIGK